MCKGYWQVSHLKLPSRLPRYDPLSSASTGSIHEARLKVRLARLRIEAEERAQNREVTHTAKGLRGGSAADLLRLPGRTRETDPYRRPLALSDGSAPKADGGPAVAPHYNRSASAIKTLPPQRVRLGPAHLYRTSAQTATDSPGRSVLDPFI